MREYMKKVDTKVDTKNLKSRNCAVFGGICRGSNPPLAIF